MSTIGKFFVVLNLALAALFVGISASLIGSGESYRKQLEDANATHVSTLAEKDTAFGALNAEFAQMRGERDRLSAENLTLKSDKQALNESLETASQKNSELTEKLTGIEAQLGNLESTNRDQAGQIAILNRTNGTLRDERDAAQTARTAAEARATAAEEKSRLADGRSTDLQNALAAMQRRAENAETERDTVVALTGTDVSAIKNQPVMEGTVLSVEYVGKDAYVVIDLGSNDKVQLGYTYDVFNGSTYKGKIRIETVNQSKSAASVTLAGTAAIAVGDRVATRL
jgi:hypothetical protein